MLNNKSLTNQQVFLLGMLPSAYDLRKKTDNQPPEVKAAQRIVDKWHCQQKLAACRHEKRMNALVDKTKDSILFDSIDKARKIVLHIRKMMLEAKCSI
jgi:hypothetical protein